ncbi:MAG TPA: 50S ribosomal protein L23 [Dehalococcoidia bacterium]|nr:50S ribosomal protein L23 [Dehalococcoidia bacterium]
MPKAIHPYTVLLRPIITEKSTVLAEQGKYVFAVAVGANKLQIKDAVELAFDVTVEAVNVMNVRGKTHRFGRRTSKSPDWRKAVVTLAPGDRIELFEGV